MDHCTMTEKLKAEVANLKSLLKEIEKHAQDLACLDVTKKSNHGKVDTLIYRIHAVLDVYRLNP